MQLSPARTVIQYRHTGDFLTSHLEPLASQSLTVSAEASLTMVERLFCNDRDHAITMSASEEPQGLYALQEKESGSMSPHINFRIRGGLLTISPSAMVCSLAAAIALNTAAQIVSSSRNQLAR